VFVIYILDASRLAQASQLQSALQNTVASIGQFAIYKKSQALFEREAVGVGLIELLGDGSDHSKQLQTI
jgi:hypothetical protein